MSDIEPVSIPVVHKGTLGEIVTRQQDQLAADFHDKATQVCAAFEGDFIIKVDGVEVLPPVTKEDVTPSRFETGVAAKLIQDLTKYRDDQNPHDKLGYVRDIVYTFRTIARHYPDRIPKYFAGYTINRALTNYTYTAPDGERFATYYADGAIEMWQSETEPVILFAIGLSQEGKPIPSDWHVLEEMYKDSKKKS